jgi:hypothetical protein
LNEEPMMKHLLAVAATLMACGFAHAEIVGVVQSPQGRIDLHDDKGPCAGQARQARFVPTAGEEVAGCWVTGGPVVMIVFFDADIARIPVAAITPPKAA